AAGSLVAAGSALWFSLDYLGGIVSASDLPRAVQFVLGGAMLWAAGSFARRRTVWRGGLLVFGAAAVLLGALGTSPGPSLTLAVDLMLGACTVLLLKLAVRHRSRRVMKTCFGLAVLLGMYRLGSQTLLVRQFPPTEIGAATVLRGNISLS